MKEGGAPSTLLRAGAQVVRGMAGGESGWDCRGLGGRFEIQIRGAEEARDKP